MTEAALTIPFALPGDSATNPYWLRMELVEEKSIMTVGQAADVIDALYNIDICGREQEQEQVPELKEKPDADDWLRAYGIIPAMPSCDGQKGFNEGDPGSYDVKVKIYRSHRAELYKLVLTNGRVNQLEWIKTRVELTLDIENKSAVTMDMPIVGRLSVGWQDIDGPVIHRMGNTLWWEGEVTGVLRAEFNTEYDLVDIHVHGMKKTSSTIITGTDHTSLGTGWYSGDEDGSELTDVQDIECTLLGFYHYQYEELQLHKPEDDESTTDDQAKAVCNGSLDVIGPDPYDREAACKKLCAERYAAGSDALSACYDQCEEDEKRCYQRADVTKICICGGDKTTATEDVKVRCPDGAVEGSVLAGETERTEYVDCGKDDLNYEEICCEPWPFGDDKPFPDCKEKHELFSGGMALSEDEIQAIKQQYGDNCIIVSVGPAKGGCGERITTQEIKQQNCCDEVTALLWDYDNSAEVIDPGSGAAVFVTGGQLPITVKVRGDGFFLDAAHSIRDAVIDGRTIGIFADADACGVAGIVVEDGCSDTGGTIKSTNGVWLDVEWHDGFCGCAGEYIGEAYGGNAFQCISGRFRLIEAARSAGSIPCGSCPTLTYVACMTKESLSPGGTITDSSPCPNNDLWKVNYPSIGDRCREALSKHITEWSCP